MESSSVLARRPPLSTLLRGLVCLSVAILPAWGILALVKNPKSALHSVQGGEFWAGVGIACLLGLLATSLVLGAVRVASRWLATKAGVYAGETHVMFRIPRLSRWWHPFVSIQEQDVALSDIQKMAFTTATRSTMRIETPNGAITIPPDAFAVGAYTLEQRIRARMPRAQEPGTPGSKWCAKVAVRLTMVMVGIALLLSFPLLLLASNPGPDVDQVVVKAGAPFMIGGIALLVMSFVYRGVVAVDDRGIFVERSGDLSFMSWDDLSKGSVRLQRETLALGLWTTLTLTSASGLMKNPACKISISRILGLGFPLSEIMDAIATSQKSLQEPSGVR